MRLDKMKQTIESHLHILEDVGAQQVYPHVLSEGNKFRH